MYNQWHKGLYLVALSHDQSTGQHIFSITINQGQDTSAVTSGRAGSVTWKCIPHNNISYPNSYVQNVAELISSLLQNSVILLTLSLFY